MGFPGPLGEDLVDGGIGVFMRTAQLAAGRGGLGVDLRRITLLIFMLLV